MSELTPDAPIQPHGTLVLKYNQASDFGGPVPRWFAEELLEQIRLRDNTVRQHAQSLQKEQGGMDVSSLDQDACIRQAVKEVIQDFLSYKLPSRSQIQQALREQKGIELTWNQVADIWYDLRHELASSQYNDEYVWSTVYTSLLKTFEEVREPGKNALIIPLETYAQGIGMTADDLRSTLLELYQQGYITTRMLDYPPDRAESWEIVFLDEEHL